MAAIAGFFFYQRRPVAQPAEENTPESAVWRMVDASRAADPDRYLACYTGEMETQLRRNLQEMGAAGFRDYLAGAHKQVKGIAISAPEMASEDEGRLAVEYVYQDRNEVQQVYVRRLEGRWKIYRVDSSQRIKTLVPYGTPVSE